MTNLVEKQTNLSEFFSALSEEKVKTKKELQDKLENPTSDLFNLFAQLENALTETKKISEASSIQEVTEEKILSIDDQNKLEVFSNLMDTFGSAKEIPEEVEVVQEAEPKEIEEPEEVISEVSEEAIKADNIIDEIVSTLDEMGEKTEVKEEIDQISALRRDFDNFKNFIQRDIANQKMSGAGSGEVRLEFLDDIDRDSVKSDGKALVYDSSDGKWKGESVLSGAITGLDIDGATDIGAAIVDADLFIIDDGAGGTNRKTAASRLKTYIGAGAADDLVAGDAAVLLTTTTGNITIDAAADNSDIILKGTDGGADTTFLTIDGSAAGAATFNDKIVATELDISGDADIDGTLEADAYTVDGTALNEYIADTVGAMVGSNTETGITVSYQDGDNTLDFVIGTLNQDTTGTAATVTTAAQPNITSLGTLTTLTVDNIVINGTNIGHTSDTDLVTVADGVLTVAGELDAATLDISGNADIDGTLEADAYTVDGTALNEYIADTVGAMVGSNTETNITVTYEDGDNTLDFVIGTLNQDTTGTADNFTVSANNSTDETVYPIFVDGATGSQGAESDTGLSYNPSTGVLTTTSVTGNLTGNVTGNTSGSAATVTTAAQTSITSLGTLTALTVDDVVINGATIGHGDDTDLMTVADGVLTVAGELDAATLDISGNADIDGTLEADAYTVDGTALNEYIADTVGAMVGSNTETGITVTYQDGDNTIDFVVGTLNQDTTGTAAKVTVTDSTANTNFPVTFHDESNALLDDTGALRYNPSTGTLLVPNLNVAGTTTQVDTVTMEAANAIIFEGATSDGNETTLTIVDPTADHTQYLINQGGYIPLLAAVTTTAITSTPAELNLLDGITAGTISASLAVIVDSNKDITGFRNVTLTGELDAATLDISGDADIDGTLEADAYTVDGTTLAEYISDTVGAMVGSNTETGITVTYQDGDNTIDFVVGTLNQDTTGTAAIATTVTITDNESTDEDNAIIFGAGGDVDGGNLGLESDGTLTYNPSTGKVTATGFIGTLTGDVTGNTSGTAATVTTAAQPNITSLGTLTTLTVDDMTLNGSTISDSGDFTIDCGADIILDADGGNIKVKDNGTTFFDIQKSSNDAQIFSRISDGDLVFRGNDGGSTITALTLDMSEGGVATFLDKVIATTFEPNADTASGDNAAIGYTSAEGLILTGQGSTNDVTIKNDADADVLEIPTGTTNVTVVGTFTSGGILKTDDATEATSTTDGSLQTDGGLSVVKDAVIGDDLIMLSDGAVIHFGADKDVVLTHVADTGIQLADGDKMLFGAGNDLQIYHDGSNSYIDDADTGLLHIRGSQININKYTGENMATFVADGAATLFYDNSAKLATASGAVNVTGDLTATLTIQPAGDTAAGDNAAIGYTSGEGLILTGQGSTSDVTIKNDADATVCYVPTGLDDLRFPDNAKLELGTSADLQIYHDGSDSYISDGGTGDLKIGGATNVKIQNPNGSEIMGIFAQDGAVTLYHDNAVKFVTASTGIDIGASGVNATIKTHSAGTSNLTLGVNAGNTIESGGNYNTLVGDEAGTAITTGDNNVAVGYAAMDANSTGSDNTALGYAALGALTTAGSNTAVGTNAALNTTSGNSNTSMGTGAFAANSTGASNVAIGVQTLDANTTAAGNTAVGYQAMSANTTGTGNVAVGYQALDAVTTTSGHTAIGYSALGLATDTGNTAVGYNACRDTEGGAYNVAVGYESLLLNTSGVYNVAIGNNALDANTSGGNNTAVGRLALSANTTASNNVAVGSNAAAATTTGHSNVSVGTNSMLVATEAVHCTAIGMDSMKAHTTGNENTAIGYIALQTNETGAGNTAVGSYCLDVNVASNNTAVGHNALGANTSGTTNDAFGVSALLSNSSGASNVAMGAYCLDANTTASNNTGVGASALSATQTGAQNTAVGTYALQAALEDNNTAVGYAAMQNCTSGEYNVAVGHAALDATLTGDFNVAVGVSALSTATSGHTNTVVGYSAARDVTTGNLNTAVGGWAGVQMTTCVSNVLVGNNAGYALTTGGYNVAVGHNALYTAATSSNQIAIGYGALQVANNTSNSNVAIGHTTGDAITDAIGNVLCGFAAGSAITTGGYNVHIGFNAGTHGAYITTGAGNVYIGNGAGASANGVSNEMTISATANSAGKGTGTGFITAGSGGMYQGSNGTAWTATSDRRIKKDIVPNTKGLEAIIQIEPKYFYYKSDEELQEELPGAEENLPLNERKTSAIAQELDPIFPEAIERRGEHDIMSVNTDPIFWSMVNAIKELSAEVEELKRWKEEHK